VGQPLAGNVASLGFPRLSGGRRGAWSQCPDSIEPRNSQQLSDLSIALAPLPPLLQQRDADLEGAMSDARKSAAVAISRGWPMRPHRDDRDELILDLLRNAGEMVSTRCAEAPVLFAKRLRRDVD
jgi:hypothetical protein